MISHKPGLGFGSALIFQEQRRKKGEMSVKARLAIWKGGALLMPLIAHSPRPGMRLQSKGREQEWEWGWREPGNDATQSMPAPSSSFR